MFSADQITSSYVSAGGSGTLTVSSGGQVVADIEFAGSYSAGNFHISSGIGGTSRSQIPVSSTAAASSSARPGLPAARHRSAGHRVRRADDARLCGEPKRDQRHADADRRPPCDERRAPRQLHGGQLRRRGRRPRRYAGHRGADRAAAAVEPPAYMISPSTRSAPNPR